MTVETVMTNADGSVPRREWNRPRRIQLMQDLFGRKGIPAASVFLGGERFTFPFADKFIVLDVCQVSHKARIWVFVCASEEDWSTNHHFLFSAGQATGPKYTEEDICKVAERVLDGLPKPPDST